MQVSNHNNVKIYSITSASRSAIPDWIARRNKDKLKNDVAWRNRIELIQDFEFPEASLRVKATRDGNYIMATGVYQPQMRVFELSQMAMKFDRHTDAENVQFEILSDDWSKSVLLQSDRTVEFHTQFGLHYKTRVPKFGRDLKYHYPSCDLFVVGASSDAWRINLEQGRFLAPLATDMPAINVAGINPAHQLLAFGGSDGRLEFWDPRERRRIGMLDVGTDVGKAVDASLLDGVPEVTALEFAADGLTFAAGVSSGQVLMYDLRRPTPLLMKDHQYGYAIKNLAFHASGNVLSADTKIVKIWNKNDGTNFTSIEAPFDINDMCVNGDSGLVMLANEGVPIQTFYIPALGPAPRWCPFLDNLTEELEENPSTTIYDDYKFVSRKELTNLGLDHLIGTNVLKAYMHGFFVDLRLYEKAKAIANPFEFEEHKRRMVQQKIDEQRKSRISAIKKLPKINQSLAAKLSLGGGPAGGDDEMDGIASESDEDKPKNKNSRKRRKEREIQALRSAATAANPLGDDRFAALFADADFQVDETSHEYRLHHPSEAAAPAPTRNFDRVDDGEDGEDGDDDGGDDEFAVGYDAPDPEGNASDSDDDAIRFARFDKKGVKSGPAVVGINSISGKRAARPAFYELKDGVHAGDLHKRGRQTGPSVDERRSKSFADRVQTEATDPSASIVRNVAGQHVHHVQANAGRADDRGRGRGRGGRGGFGEFGGRGSRAGRGEDDEGGERSEKRGVRDLGLRGGPSRGRGRGGSGGGRGRGRGSR